MHPFVTALSHLFVQSLHGAVGWMGTTLLAVGVGAVNQFVVPWVDRLIEGEKPAAKPFFKRIRGTTIVAASTWILIYGANVVYTIYDHHRIVVKNNQEMLTKLTSQEQELSRLRASLQQDEEKIRTLTLDEPKDSLRRRTILVADEWRAYLLKRAEARPPFAAPNSSDPNPSEETKKSD